MSYETILYATEGALATISLNRPHRLNSIVPPMPEEIEDAVHRANRDGEVKVIVLREFAKMVAVTKYLLMEANISVDGQKDNQPRVLASQLIKRALL